MKKVELNKVTSTLEEIKEYSGDVYSVEYTNQELPTIDREIKINFRENIANNVVKNVTIVIYKDFSVNKFTDAMALTGFYAFSTRVVVAGQVVATTIYKTETLDNLKVKINNLKKGMF